MELILAILTFFIIMYFVQKYLSNKIDNKIQAYHEESKVLDFKQKEIIAKQQEVQTKLQVVETEQQNLSNDPSKVEDYWNKKKN